MSDSLPTGNTTLLTVLGSTGSIGVNTLNVVRQWPGRFGIYALVAGRNVELLAEQIAEFRPHVVVVADDAALVALRSALRERNIPEPAELGHGNAARVAASIAPEAGFVMSAIVGVEGLEATYEAIVRKKRVGLANKEVLVSAGKLVMEARERSGAEMIPVDSEHNGAHQCLRGGRDGVRKLILTASGGPFRETPRENLASVTPVQALNHPTWKMGQRITIDSATLMNKGFEVIEACWLFDFSPDDVDVVVHPESKVHAMVEYADGSVIAQVCATDMRMPIQYAMTYPERAAAPVPRIDWSQQSAWRFFPPDFQKFPLLGLAYQAQRSGGAATAILNAADEIAVAEFLDGKIPFPGIWETVAETLEKMPVRQPGSIADVLAVDREARRVAAEVIAKRYTGSSVQTEAAVRA
ncbi:MAG: 1-deoxy-D-xylulose-5-phosphate reductoisomerase [Acidobacteriota bacterium]